MKAIHAVYENGVFRPTEPVDLPDGSSVQVVPEPTATADKTARRRIFENLSTSFETGDPHAAARHDEHQP